MPVVGLLAGMVLGLVLSLLGAGGSIFTVPVLVYVLGAPVAEATGTSLAIVCSAALVGAVGHWRKGHLDLPVTGWFGVPAMVGAVGGAALHPLVPQRILLGFFAGLLFLAAVRMAMGPPAQSDEPILRAPGVLIPLGAGIGVLSGVFGVGGGFLMVPALTWGARLPIRMAVGTSLAVIALSSLSGTVGHALQGHVRGSVLAVVGGGAVLGALAGAPLSGKLPERPIRLAFAVLTLAVGVFMAVKVATGA